MDNFLKLDRINLGDIDPEVEEGAEPDDSTKLGAHLLVAALQLGPDVRETAFRNVMCHFLSGTPASALVTSALAEQATTTSTTMVGDAGCRV